jgi:hypothetical protein
MRSARRPDPIQIRNVPAPLPTPAPSTPPFTADSISLSRLRVNSTDMVELVSRPPTPAPSPTLSSSKYLDDGGVDVLAEKGKARAQDGELVGPDLRNEASLADLGEQTTGWLERADELGPVGLLLRFQKMKKDQRAAFLAGLVEDLDLEEASTVTRRIEPRLRRDFLKELPLEIALHCMSFVSPP